MGNSPIVFIFLYFFNFISIFGSISQRCLRKWVKFFFSNFYENFHITYFDVENSKVKLIFSNFFISSSFLPQKSLIHKFAFTLLIFICWLLWYAFIHFLRKPCVFRNVLQRFLFPQLFVHFLQYHNKITKSFWFSWAILFQIVLHVYQYKCLHCQTLQVKYFKFRLLLQKILLLSNFYCYK